MTPVAATRTGVLDLTVKPIGSPAFTGAASAVFVIDTCEGLQHLLGVRPAGGLIAFVVVNVAVLSYVAALRR